MILLVQHISSADKHTDATHSVASVQYEILSDFNFHLDQSFKPSRDTAAAAPLPFRLSNPALYGSHATVTP